MEIKNSENNKFCPFDQTNLFLNIQHSPKRSVDAHDQDASGDRFWAMLDIQKQISLIKWTNVSQIWRIFSA